MLSNGKNKIQYFYCDPRTIRKRDTSRTIHLPTEDIVFELPKQTLQNLIKAASVLQLPFIVIEPANGNVLMSAANPNNPTSNKVTYEVGETDREDFKMLLNFEYMKMLPDDYDVTISSSRLTHWRSRNRPVEYFIACEKNSEFKT
jgi:hypothetical protein